MLAERHEPNVLPGPVFIKRLHTPASRARRQRLVEEVQLAYRLSHPAIAQVHHFKVRERKPYVVMEYVDGPSLDTVLCLMALRGRPVSVAFALFVGAELADALDHAHSLTDEEGRPLGLVHRDVSPRNVRVARDGTVKLTHFGAAYSHLVGRVETQGLLRKGDVAYASPEYLSLDPLTPASDLFSLGLSLLELATGRHLFQAALECGGSEEPTARHGLQVEEEPSLPLTCMLAQVRCYTAEDVACAVAELPEAFGAALQQALRREPGARQVTAGALRDVLRDCLALEQRREGGRLYGRKEAAEELARLVADASVARDQVELEDEDLFPMGLEAHALTRPSVRKRRK
ncbi:serine/threonine protein kinase [Corallococcus terminator]|uniref:Serine/threonine protein kinase n=2 Tax=Corallococcus terminator TaxID=2316733 RepID=A0A3A8HQQ6_9BACT|nr:serine/threonine protein kinase [Corallococcus terminator]